MFLILREKTTANGFDGEGVRRADICLSLQAEKDQQKQTQQQHSNYEQGHGGRHLSYISPLNA